MTTSTATSKSLTTGEGILELIPQRPPIVMVDVLWKADESSAETGLTIAPDNIFVEDGRLRESGIVEHVAQSAATFNGYGFRLRGLAPTLGYIAEIKKFRVESLPVVGSRLRTEIAVLGDAGGVLLVSAVTRCGEETIASGQMKLFITTEE